MARVVIAGCGYVGTALGLELAAAGHDVFGLRRDPRGLPGAIRPLAADLASGPPDLPADVDFGVYCVGADAGDERAYRAAYVDGLAAFLDALSRAPRPPRRVLFTSSTSVYGQRDGEWVDEESATEPARATGRILLDAEALARGAAVPVTVVRLGGIYGPGRTRLVERVASGAVPLAPASAPPHYTNRIHRDDASGILRFLMLDLPPSREPAALYLGVDCEPAAERDVVAFLARALGVAGGTPPVDPTAADGRRAGSKRCSNARLRAAGYRFRVPTYREGYPPLVAEVLARRAAAAGEESAR